MQRHRVSRSDRHFRAVADQARSEGNDSPETIERRAQGGGPEDHGHHAPGCLAEGGRGDHDTRRNTESVLRGFAGMNAFRYEALEAKGTPASRVIEAEDR